MKPSSKFLLYTVWKALLSPNADSVFRRILSSVRGCQILVDYSGTIRDDFANRSLHPIFRCTFPKRVYCTGCRTNSHRPLIRWISPVVGESGFTCILKSCAASLSCSPRSLVGEKEFVTVRLQPELTVWTWETLWKRGRF
jgi:hypothetical protein